VYLLQVRQGQRAEGFNASPQRSTPLVLQLRLTPRSFLSLRESRVRISFEVSRRSYALNVVPVLLKPLRSQAPW
jgi:hypothetical protein